MGLPLQEAANSQKAFVNEENTGEKEIRPGSKQGMA